MDFNDNAQEAEFRANVASWLKENAVIQPNLVIRPDEERVAAARKWQKIKFDAGYAALTWPKEYGGAELSSIFEVIYRQEEAKLEVPTNTYEIGIGMILPTILAMGSEEQKSRYLESALNGEEIWCQMFSEPAAGSDVAALRTKAEKDGDEWVVNGQKVWTSGAQYADLALLLVRTDPTLPKHKGLSAFILDIRTPGVEIRPINQISGGAEFNEVFLTDVRIKESQMVGKPGQGWAVAVRTLMNERLTVFNSYPTRTVPDVVDLLSDLSDGSRELLDNATVSECLVNAYVIERGLEMLKYRLLTKVSMGQDPGPEASLGKLLSSRSKQETMALILDSLGLPASLIGDAQEDPLSEYYFTYYTGIALRIGGGTEDIQKNIIAEHVLGLPPGPRTDKDIPFNQLAEVTG